MTGEVRRDEPSHAKTPLARRTETIVAAARAMVADANDLSLRGRYVRATFNHDWTAEVIVALADRAGEP